MDMCRAGEPPPVVVRVAQADGMGWNFDMKGDASCRQTQNPSCGNAGDTTADPGSAKKFRLDLGQ